MKVTKTTVENTLRVALRVKLTEYDIGLTNKQKGIIIKVATGKVCDFMYIEHDDYSKIRLNSLEENLVNIIVEYGLRKLYDKR